ncbi:glycosyltransferase [Halodurantibacterium flavum]|uniref:Glycosyltransferase n=1 Tax=Halodurantibacterium flavum TaxID=1382802 RepID=A0ABW4S6R2_9RHOB
MTPLIPKIIHQTWRDHDLPEPRHWPESWKKLNPEWEYRLWTDADLLDLVRTYYPELEELYLSYPRPVQRADMGRYLILHHCGGIYADLDTECLIPLDPLAADSRVVLAEEPIEHRYNGIPLGMDRLFFNGVMASPQGHPFWGHVIATLVRCRHARDHVLESTGPFAFTGAVESFDRPETLALHSCHIFTAMTAKGGESAGRPHGPHGDTRFCTHYWRGSWFPKGRHRRHRLKRAIARARYRLTRGAFLDRDEAARNIDVSLLHRPVTATDRNVAVLIPVRDGEPFLDRCMELLHQLDYPRDRLKIVFCEGDSKDRSAERLREIATGTCGFRDIVLTEHRTGAPLDRARRSIPKLQHERRANLARVRNHLIDHGLDATDDWALWLDVDVCDYAPDTLNRLLAERHKVVTPDCVRDWGGPSYDLNAFHDSAERRDHRYYRHVHRGLYMPPASHDRRRHLHDLRFLDRVPLSSVGGTMLLVHAAVHRAGLRFPELPYDDLLETEGFGRMCRDFGVMPLGLPNLQIRHVKS